MSNRRTDAYGGSRDNRMRFTLEVVEAVRGAIPDGMPLFLRLSSIDGKEEGWMIEDSVELARRVKALGVDVIDCSSGGMRGSPVVGAGPIGYGYQVPYAEKLRKEADIMSMAVGLIVHADQAETILQEGRADLIALAREVMYNPNWAVDAAVKLGVEQPYALMPPAYDYWLAKRAGQVEDLTPSTHAAGLDRLRA